MAVLVVLIVLAALVGSTALAALKIGYQPERYSR